MSKPKTKLKPKNYKLLFVDIIASIFFGGIWAFISFWFAFGSMDLSPDQQEAFRWHIFAIPFTLSYYFLRFLSMFNKDITHIASGFFIFPFLTSFIVTFLVIKIVRKVLKWYS